MAYRCCDAYSLLIIHTEGVAPSLYDDELACRFYENRYSFDDVYLGGEMYWHLWDYVFTYCHNVYSKK